MQLLEILGDTRWHMALLLTVGEWGPSAGVGPGLFGVGGLPGWAFL